MNVPPSSSRQRDARLSPLVALRHRNFRLLFFGQLVSQAGTQMQLVAINWHIYILTNSALALGLIGLVRVAPIIVFSLLGGVFADAHDRRRVLLVTQSAMMLLAFILGWVTHAGWVSAFGSAGAAFIYLFAALTAATMAFDGPARQALTPNLVPKEHLTNALSISSVMRQIAAIAGPSLAGFVIAWRGVAAVYWINAVSFLAVLLALALMKTPPQQNGAKGITLSALSEGIHFVRRSQIILSTMLLHFIETFFSSASALLPIFAREILQVGPKGLGILYAAGSVGSVIAGAGMSFAGNVKKKGRLLLWAGTLYGVATTLYGMSRWFALSFLFLALVGAANTVNMILRNTIWQLATPDYLRGRMTSVNMIFSLGGPQLGNLEAGLVATLIGAPLSVITGGVATILTVLAVAWLVPLLRNYQD